MSWLDYSDVHSKHIQTFLSKTNQASRLKFYRDAAYRYVLIGPSHVEIKDGLLREAELLKLRAVRSDGDNSW